MSQPTSVDQEVVFEASCCNARKDGRLVLIEQSHCDHDDGIGNCPNWEALLDAVGPWAHWRWIGPDESAYDRTITHLLVAP